jgi:hypothetical protein
MHTGVTPFAPSTGKKARFRGPRILYAAHVMDGELRDETEGTSDRAQGVDLAEVTDCANSPRSKTDLSRRCSYRPA